MEPATSSVVIAVFGDHEHARLALKELHERGLHDEHVGFVVRGDQRLDRELVARDCRIAEASVTGALAGASLGGLWGVAMATGLLPVIGPVIAGGLLASVVVTAATGAAVGGLSGALVGLGIPEHEAALFEEELEQGNVVLTVQADADRVPEVTALLTELGSHPRVLDSSPTRSAPSPTTVSSTKSL